MKTLITDIQRFSLNDGPGIRTTVFFKGCNMCCTWCHNPETLSAVIDLMFYSQKCIACGKCFTVCPNSAHKMLNNTHVIDRTACTKCGYSKELARRRVAAGCHWMCIPGMEYTMNDTVKINLLRTFEVAFDEMMETADCSVTRLFEFYKKHLKIAVDATGKGIMHHLKYQTKSQPELILNLFQHGLIAKGVNITDGGANYYNMCVDGSGLAVVADSFAALEQRIEQEGKLTYNDLYAHIKTNFAATDGEYIRQLMLHSQRYGGGNNSLGDLWAERVKDLYTSLVRDLCNHYKGVNFIPGFFSWSNTILLGKSVGATPNGRKSGQPINHGANPCSGFRTDGAVTAMCNSIAKVQPAFGNTAPVQLEVDPGIANNQEGIDKMAAMVKTIMNSGNTLLNINIIDTDKILEAHKNPLKYPDLVVRVTGFTAYFAMLSPEFRQLVVDRIASVNPRQMNPNSNQEKGE